MSEFAGVMASLNSGGGESSGASDAASSPDAATPVASSLDASSSPDTTPSASDATIGTDDTAAAVPRQESAGPPKMVPYARLSEVVEKRNQLESQLQALSWAQGIPAQHVPGMQQLYQGLQTDPIGTLVGEADALIASGHPEAAQALRSAAARWLRQGRAPAPAPEIDLTPSLQSEDGQPVYTAQQVEALVARQVEAQLQTMQQQLQPLQQDAQERKIQAMVQEIRGKAKAQADEIRAYPHFEQHKAEILQVLRADATISPEKAWMRVVLPKLTLAERQQAAKELQAKAQAGAVAPGRAAVASTAPKPASFREAYAQVVAESQRR